MGGVMKEYDISEQSKEKLLTLLEGMIKKRKQGAIAAVIYSNAVAFAMLVYFCFANSGSDADKKIFAALLAVYTLLLVVSALNLRKVFLKNSLILRSLKSAEQTFYTAPLSRVNGWYYADGFFVIFADPRHLGKAREGDEVLLIKISEKECLGVLRSQVDIS